MRERLQELRTQLGLSQEEFGKRIGVSRFSISNYEAGTRNITERVITDICREFHVDYIWFTTGEGEKFIKSNDEIPRLIDRIMYGESELAKSLFRGFAQFNIDDWLKLEEIIKKFLSGFTKEEVEAYLTGTADDQDAQKKEADHDDQPPET